MSAVQEIAPASIQPDTSALRMCPGCGCGFEPGGRGFGKTFHSEQCRQRWRSVHLAQGFPLAPMVKAWHATRHAPAGTREAAICTFARGQITAMASMFLDEDEADGIHIVAYVGQLMDSKTQYMDRRRR